MEEKGSLKDVVDKIIEETTKSRRSAISKYTILAGLTIVAIFSMYVGAY